MNTHPKKQLRIIQCRDSLMWYASLVGQTVPYLGTWPEGYRSREPAGYINVVRFQDAEVIDVDGDDATPTLPEIHSDRRTMQAAGTHPAPCASTCEATAFQIEIRRLKAELARYDPPNPASPLKPHVFRELVNDLRDLAKQYHDHDSLRDRISGRLREDVQPNEAQAEIPIKRKPTGFVAICQCGLIVGAMDFTRTEKKDAGKILGDWLAAGCTVDPRFSGNWGVHVEPCRCRNQSSESRG